MTPEQRERLVEVMAREQHESVIERLSGGQSWAETSRHFKALAKGSMRDALDAAERAGFEWRLK